MSYDTTHPDYDKQSRLWRFMADSLNGQEIKRKRTIYLPKTNGQLEVEATINRDTRRVEESGFALLDVEKLYDSYLNRAKYPMWVKDQLRTMMGLVSNLPFNMDVPDVLKGLEDNATSDGLTLRQLFQRAVSGLLTHGRYVLTPDIDENGNLFIRHYVAEQFINWKVQNVKGRQDITVAVFSELKDASNDSFDHDFDLIYRAFILDEHGCHQYVYQNGVVIEDRYLGFENKPIQYVPIVVLGSTQNSTNIDELPLLTIAECALTYYQKSADVNQAMHDGCSFQTVVFGLEQDQDIGFTGGGTIWTLPSKEKCDVKIVEPTFANLKVAIDEMNKQKEMASEAGAKVIDIGVESGEARIARQRDQYATLRSIILNVAEAIQQVLRYGYDLVMYNNDTAQHKNILFTIEAEFSEAGIDVSLLNSLKEMATMNKLSWDSVWSYVQDGAVPKRAYAQEQELIESEQVNAPLGGYQPNGVNNGSGQSE